MLRSPEPVLTADLFAEDRAALIEVLGDLSDDEWARPTDCPGWSVRDVAAHLLGVDLANLSRRRDGYRGVGPLPEEPIVAFVNRINDEWMLAARRLSPRVIRDLLAVVGAPLFAYFASVDPMQLGSAVSWAGPEPAPVWLDLAREYTERWHHQQHIRDAVGRSAQTSRRFLYPVLATFAHALPLALRSAEAPVGTTATLHVSGEAGGDWTVKRDHDAWRLYLGAPEAPSAQASTDPRTAWRLYTKGIGAAEGAASATFAGDRDLAERLLKAVAIIA
jgi:uncharacterized protein (TIGR03083 family)